LSALLCCFFFNFQEYENSNRYELPIKQIAILIWYYCGGTGYTFLAKNLPGVLPQSLSYTKAEFLTPFPLGFNDAIFDEAFDYYRSRNYSQMMFTISEDSTAVVPGMQWEEKENKLVGIIRGKEFSAPAENMKQIIDVFKSSSIACDIHVYMLNPLDPRIPSFVIGVFPSDRKENSALILSRWKIFEDMASARKMKILGHSSDGEPKQMSAMRQFLTTAESYYSLNSTVWKGIKVPKRKKFDTDLIECCFQDMMHIGTKLRNNLLSKTRRLIFGEKPITLDALQNLLKNRSELRIHCRPSDLSPHDKMNFAAVERLCNRKLLKEIKSQDFTLYLYLKLIRYSTFSFIDQTIPLEKRISQISYACFLVLSWRKINKSEKNRITSNQLQCIVINFVNLLCLISYLHENAPDQHLFPSALGSQSNENFFRKLRSMAGTFTVGINFTVRDVLLKIRAIFTVLGIESVTPEIKSPSHDKHLKKSQQFHYQTCNDFTPEVIFSHVKKGIDKLRKDLEAVGFADMIPETVDFEKVIKPRLKASATTDTVELIDDEDDEEDDEYYSTLLLDDDGDNVEGEGTTDSDITSNKKCFVYDSHGVRVHKQKLCSILSAHSKLPLDRLLRVRNWQKIVYTDSLKTLLKVEEEEKVEPPAAPQTPEPEQRDEAYDESNSDFGPNLKPPKRNKILSSDSSEAEPEQLVTNQRVLRNSGCVCGSFLDSSYKGNYPCRIYLPGEGPTEKSCSCKLKCSNLCNCTCNKLSK
jgi:hypothetical protein